MQLLPIQPTLRTPLPASLLLAALFFGVRAHAGAIDWDAGGDGTNWDSPGNWVAGQGLPTSNAGDTLVFGNNAAARLGTPINNLSGYVGHRLNTTASSTGAWTLSGNALTLAWSAATQARIFHASAYTASFDFHIALSGGNLLLETRGLGDLIINGNLTGANGVDVSAVNANGKIYLNGTNSYSGTTQILAPGGSATQTYLVAKSVSVPGNVTLASAATFIEFNQTSDGTYAGSISGSGSVIKTGAGRLTLSGTNTPAGGVTVRAGTLALSGGAALTNSTPVVLDGGALDAQASTGTAGPLTLSSSSTMTTESDGSIAFADSSAVAWSGTLTINDTISPTSIRFGTNANGLTTAQIRAIRIGGNYARLDANGYLQPLIASAKAVSGDNSDVNYFVVGGGKLSGTGTIGSINAAALSKLAPGDEVTRIATLNVAGNVDMEFSSALRVDANRSSGSFSNDLIAASGNVHFFGTIDLFLDGEPLQAGDEITVLTGTVPMPTYRDVPAQVVVDPASPTPLPAGLQLKVVYHSDKITVLAQSAPAANVLRNGEFEQGLFFWETSAAGAAATFSIDDSEPDSGPTCLRIDVTGTGANWAALQLFQHFHVESGQQYTISFRYRVSADNPGAGGNELAVSLSNSKLSRDFTKPAINTFGPAGVNAAATDTWHTYTRTFTAGATDAASLNLLLGLSAAGTTIWIDTVKVTTTGSYPPPPSNFKVVGYVPAYRYNNIPLAFYENVDSLIYGFIMIDSSGNGDLLEYYQTSPGSPIYPFNAAVEAVLLDIKSTHGLELLVALGGGGVDPAVFFNNVLSSPSNRTNLINNLITFCNAHGFDGVDLDYEYPASGTNEQENYALLVSEMKSAFTGAKAGGGDLAVTAAVDTFYQAYYPPSTYLEHDRNHLMGYAKDLDLHINDIFQLFTAGAPMASIYPGIIWSAEDAGTTTTYAAMHAQYAPARHENEAGGYIFNGIDAVRQKIQLARALGCGGIMIWELSHDTSDAATSLIRNALEDADNDALLDAWEQEHSGGINLRAFGDDDRDGLWNLWENLTNTNPLDGGSRAAPTPAIQNISGMNYLAIQFPYINPQRLDLFVSGSNGLSSWTDLDTTPGIGNAEATEAGGILTIRQTNSIGSANDFSFMRISLQPKP